MPCPRYRDGDAFVIPENFDIVFKNRERVSAIPWLRHVSFRPFRRWLRAPLALAVVRGWSGDQRDNFTVTLRSAWEVAS
jgi:hypothetical protein